MQITCWQVRADRYIPTMEADTFLSLRSFFNPVLAAHFDNCGLHVAAISQRIISEGWVTKGQVPGR